MVAVGVAAEGAAVVEAGEGVATMESVCLSWSVHPVVVVRGLLHREGRARKAALLPRRPVDGAIATAEAAVEAVAGAAGTVVALVRMVRRVRRTGRPPEAPAVPPPSAGAAGDVLRRRRLRRASLPRWWSPWSSTLRQAT